MTWLLKPFLIAGLSTVLTTVGGARLFGAPLGLTGPHWAFQPIARAEIPSGPTGSPIDQLVRAEMSGAEPVPEADRRTLIRRLSFDLRGLPPTPPEVAAFLADQRPDAWARLIEQFLASPHYGERWGRHWLDLAAYADSNGYFNADSDRPLAWKYRDYVVRSLQQDKPFNRFIQEQIAGDELVGFVRDGDVLPDMVDSLIATQFLRNAPDGTGESDGNPLEVKVDRYSVIEGTVQLIGNTFLGLTLQCARCHDHKFEPITQTDYYALQAILRPAYDPVAWLKPNERTVSIGTRFARDSRAEEVKQFEANLKTLRANLAGFTAPFRHRLLLERLAVLDEPIRQAVLQACETKEKDRNDAVKGLLKSHAALVEISDADLSARFKDVAIVLENLKALIQRREAGRPPPLEQIAVLTEPSLPPPIHHLLVRGNHADEGVEVPPAVPVALNLRPAGAPDSSQRHLLSSSEDPGRPAAELLTNSQFRSPQTTGRRLNFARWLTAPENPLVARVLVNRIWFYHFGQGLVPSVDNLGRSGARPTNPKLLDWLASEFISQGWSLKHLHRVILSSAAWKQKGDGLLTPSLRRLDAESQRDALLAVSGELDHQIGGPYTPITVDSDGQIVINEAVPGAKRRSLYLQQRRTQPVALLQVFDGAAHNPVCVQRVQSTVALQSLAQLNSDFIRVRSRNFARRILADADLGSASPDSLKLSSSPARSVMVAAFEHAWARPPTSTELSAAEDFFAVQSTLYAHHSDALERAWTDFCQSLLVSNAFLYVE